MYTLYVMCYASDRTNMFLKVQFVIESRADELEINYGMGKFTRAPHLRRVTIQSVR